MSTRRHRFTLIELLVAMVIGAGVAGAGYVLLNRTFRYRDAVEKRLELQTNVRLLTAKWRAWAAPTDPRTWRSDGTRFLAAGRSAEVKDGKLILTAGGKTARLALPPNVTAELSVEPSPSAPPGAILRLKWTTKRGDRTEAHSVRIVACAHPKSAAKAK